MTDLETKIRENICIEFNISYRKWFHVRLYRPPLSNKLNILNIFFEELKTSLGKLVNKYGDLIVTSNLKVILK